MDMLTQGTILFSKVKQRCITVKHLIKSGNVYRIKIPQMLKKKANFMLYCQTTRDR